MRQSFRLSVLIGAILSVVGLAPLPAALSAPLPVRVTTHALGTEIAAAPFTMAGISWAGTTTPAVRIRTSRDGSTWDAWTKLEGEPGDAPDRGAEGEGRSALGPVWTGPARRIEVDIEGDALDARLHLVDTSGATASALDRLRAMWRGAVAPTPARAAAIEPPIVTRAEWGADESLRRYFVGYGRRTLVALVHHTAGTNSYARSDVPEIIRGIYAYHVEAMGWTDIGYNFLVDRYGTIYEGRWGGIDKAVIGAHTEGFNSKSTGIALIGNFSSAGPTSESSDALTSLLAWKLDVHHIDPNGRTAVVSAGNDTYPAGQEVVMRNVSGHRDALATACPGAALYAALPSLAARAAPIGLPKIYGGRASPNPVLPTPKGWPPVTFGATLTTDTTWALTVTTPAGTVLGEWSGSGQSANVAWAPSTMAGGPLPPGEYPFTLTAGPGFRPVEDRLTLGPPASFDTYLLVGNPTTETAEVLIDLATPTGDVVPYSLVVGPQSRGTLYLNEVLSGSEVSTRLSSTVPVVAERAMYFAHAGITGGSDAVGARSPALEWHFAEGYTAPGFEEYLTLQNPGLSATVATIEYMFPSGETLTSEVTLAATSRTTVSVNDQVGPGREVSARVTAGAPIVAERPMYYSTPAWKGGDVVMGVVEPALTWYFAEGYTGDGFDEYLTIQNPSDLDGVYAVTFMDREGEITSVTRTIPARSRDTVDAIAAIGRGKEVSARVDSTVPLVAERPMYFTFKGRIRDGHNSTGATAPALAHYFAEGYTGSDFDEYLTLQNPGLLSAQVTVTYFLGAGAPVVREHAVAPLSRATIDVSRDVGRGQEVSTYVESTEPLVVERPMYFDYYGAWDGGHVATGVSSAATEWLFAEGFTA